MIIVTSAMLVGPHHSMAQGGVSQDAAAEPAPAEELFEQGKALFTQGATQAAYRTFLEAWRAERRADIGANLAVVELTLGLNRDAAEHFAFALEHPLLGTTEEQHRKLVAAHAEAKAKVGTLKLAIAPRGAAVVLDGTRLGVAPLDREIYVDPGTHVLRVSATGGRVKQVSISIGAGEVHPIRLAFPAFPVNSTPETPETMPAGEARQPSTALVLVGAAVTATGAALGIVFLGNSNSAYDSADAERARLAAKGSSCKSGARSAECSELAKAWSDHDRSQNLAVASFAIAGGAALGTVVYWLWPRPGSAATVRPRLELGPAQGKIGLGGVF